MIVRAVVLVAALATAGWLATTIPSVRAKARGEAVVDRPERQRLSPSDVDRALDDFASARRRQPDGGVARLEASLLIRVGRAEQAADVLRPLVRNEPRNVTAWALLSIALARSDPAGAARARERARKLAPPVG